MATIHVVHPYDGETRQIECIGVSVAATCDYAELMGIVPDCTDWTPAFATGAEFFAEDGTHIIVTEG